MSQAGEYRLVVYPEGIDPHRIRDVLAAELGLHATDAMRLAAHAPGVIPRALTEDEAQRLVEAMEAAAIDAERWEADQLPDLSEPRPVYKVLCRKDGMEAIGARDEPVHWLPWSQVELISVGVVARGPRQRRLTAPSWLQVAAAVTRPLALGRSLPGQRTIRVARPSIPEIWIVRDRPVQALRVQQDRMNYEYLAERLQTSTTANFRLLLDDLLRWATSASITPAAHSFLTYDRPGHHFFASAQDLMEYTTWQLLLRWRSHEDDGAA